MTDERFAFLCAMNEDGFWLTRPEITEMLNEIAVLRRGTMDAAARGVVAEYASLGKYESQALYEHCPKLDAALEALQASAALAVPDDPHSSGAPS